MKQDNRFCLGHAEPSKSYNSVTYEFDKNSKYEISKSNEENISNQHLGSFSILGDFEINEAEEVPLLNAKSGNLAFTYKTDDGLLSVPEDQWHICSDKTKTVDSISIEKKIENGM